MKRRTTLEVSETRIAVRNCEKSIRVLRKLVVVQLLLAEQRREDPLLFALDAVVRQH